MMKKEKLEPIGGPNPPVKTRQEILLEAANLMEDSGYTVGSNGMNTSVIGPHCIAGAVGAVAGALDIHESQKIAEMILGVDYYTIFRASDRMQGQYPFRKHIQSKYRPDRRAARILRDMSTGTGFYQAVARERVYEKSAF